MRPLIAAVTFALVVALTPHLQGASQAPAVDLTPIGSAGFSPAAQLTASATLEAAAKGPRTLRQKGRIVKVVDGDTVDVRLTRSRRVLRVRMIGIDTPEVHGTVECGGARASRWLKKRLPRRTRVILVSDSTQDRKDHYGRALRYVIRAKGRTDMNRAQVARGNAEVYVFNRYRPFKRVDTYRSAERRAKKARRGIWGAC